MEVPKPRIHLDRAEAVLVFGLFLLVAAMTFTLGVLVGHGLGSHDGAGVHLTKSTEKAVEGLHGAEDSGESEKGTHGKQRQPASDKGRSVPGQDLRKAFRESKQQSLVEMALRENGLNKPKSVADTEAHLAAHAEWNRKPAQTQETVAKKSEFETARQSEKVREDKGVPVVVKHLFERKPTALDTFEPRSGGYTVQIASYASLDEANAKIAQLRRGGFNEAYFEIIRVKGGEGWHRVGVGSYPNSDWARKTGDKLVRRGLAHDFVIRQVP